MWPGLSDPFTSVKWHVLGVLAATTLVAERWRGGRGLPAFVRRTWPGGAALTALVLVGSLRHGPAWATAPLVARASFGALALASYWSFRREGLGFGAWRGGVALAAALVIPLGLAQMAGLPAIPWLAGGDGLSATFGNVNMAAQFAGLALVVLFARPPDAGTSLRRRLALETLGAGGFLYVALAGTRSVALALVAAFAVLALVRRSREAFARAGVAVAVATLAYLLPLASAGPWGAEARASKAASARWRLAVWGDTLDLVRDRPLGVGAGNFEPAFVPYALAGRSRPGETLVFRSPHNDYLRLLAEEGAPGAALLLALLALLLRELRRSPAIDGWRSEAGALLAACGAFLAVEAFFQFPFEMAFPALVAALLLGLALAAVEGPGEPGPARPAGRPGSAAAVLLAAALLGGVVRLGVAETLSATRRGDPAALERACALDPRRLEACVQAAWLRSRAGDHPAAQRLLGDVLDRAPAYFPAIKLRAEDLLSAGDREAGCRWARAYDALLGAARSRPVAGSEGCPPPPPGPPR